MIDGRTKASIAQELAIDKDVVALYVQLEADRRAVEREKERNAEIDRSVAIYNDVGRYYRDKMDRPGARGDEGRYVLAARERVDKLLGLEAPLKLKDETSPSVPFIGAVDPKSVTALLHMAIAAKQRPEQI